MIINCALIFQEIEEAGTILERGTQLTNRFKQSLLDNRVVNSRGLRSREASPSNLEMPSNNGLGSKAGIFGPIVTAERPKRLVVLEKGGNSASKIPQ
jgi:hypothetical protein